MIMVNITPIDRTMETRSAKPEKLAVRGQVLSERKKGIGSPENSHYECKYLASTFRSDTLRCNQQNDPIGDILECFISSNVGVGRPTEENLSENEYEKQERWRVQRVFR